MDNPNEMLNGILERLMIRLQWALDQPTVDLDYLEYVCNQEYILIDAASRVFYIPPAIIEGLEHLGRLVQSAIEDEQRPTYFSLEQGQRGRPKFVFASDFLQNLLEIPLPVKCVASLLGVSEITIYRRMREEGISTKTTYSSMSDEELDSKVAAVKANAPNAGYRLVKGMLQSEGYRVQWHRIKGSMHRIDSAGVLSRLTSMGSTVRRAYCVRGPLSLLHIDTNHKLIRYNIVIFGNADGYSRKVLYLHAANNNRSSTALGHPNCCAESRKRPSRVRGDQGVENLGIARCMFTVRGTGRASFVSGKSVHNQRIERLWRDVWMAVTQIYYEVLHRLEEEDLLDLANPYHMYCVHYVFLPRLNDHLSKFIDGWNNHPLRTEQNLSPNQLWAMGHIQSPTMDPELPQELDGVDSVHWEDTGIPTESCGGIEVPEILTPFTPEQTEQLQRNIDPRGQSQCYGRDIYLNMVQHVQQFLEN